FSGEQGRRGLELAALDARHDLGEPGMARRRHAGFGALARDVSVHRVDLGAPALRMSCAIDGRWMSARGFEPALGTMSASTSESARASPSEARAIVSGSTPRIF